MQRLSPGTLIVGVFAILLGLMGAYGVKKFLTQEQPAPVAAEPPKEQPLRIPVAVTDLPAGRKVAETDVATILMRKEDLPKANFPRFWMESVAQITNRTLREPIKMGQPFQPTAFYPAGIGPDISTSLKPGERAVTIPAAADAADMAFVTPGAVVDVLFRSKADSNLEIPDATVTLLSGVRVLAVGQDIVEGSIPQKGDSPQDQGAQQARTVTLAVNQAQARALKVVEGRGSLSLILRNAKDTSVADKAGPTTLPGLLGMEELQQPFVSEIYRAGRLATMTFRGDQRLKVVLDPPYGMPVIGDKIKPDAELELRLPRSAFPGWGAGYNGVGGTVPGSGFWLNGNVNW